MRTYLLRTMALLGASLFLAACSKGGELVLEPGAKIVKSKGSPYVSVNQGGHANLTSAGGVRGWVTIQSVSARNLSSGTHNMILNKTAAYQ